MSAKLQYLGHSSFLLTADNGWKCVFDPYADDSVPGLKLPEVTADDVVVSHGHSDHNAVYLVKRQESKIPCPYTITVLKTDHDDQQGALRGKNDITILKSDQEKIVHCGDLGRKLTLQEIEALRQADAIMIPCGGYYTIDATTARDMIEAIRPKLTVLMHYRRGDVGYDVLSSLDDVCAIIPNVQILKQTEVEIGAITGVVALDPRQ